MAAQEETHETLKYDDPRMNELIHVVMSRAAVSSAKGTFNSHLHTNLQRHNARCSPSDAIVYEPSDIPATPLATLYHCRRVNTAWRGFSKCRVIKQLLALESTSEDLEAQGVSDWGPGLRCARDFVVRLKRFIAGVSRIGSKIEQAPVAVVQHVEHEVSVVLPHPGERHYEMDPIAVPLASVIDDGVPSSGSSPLRQAMDQTTTTTTTTAKTVATATSLTELVTPITPPPPPQQESTPATPPATIVTQITPARPLIDHQDNHLPVWAQRTQALDQAAFDYPSFVLMKRAALYVAAVANAESLGDAVMYNAAYSALVRGLLNNSADATGGMLKNQQLLESMGKLMTGMATHVKLVFAHRRAVKSDGKASVEARGLHDSIQVSLGDLRERSSSIQLEVLRIGGPLAVYGYPALAADMANMLWRFEQWVAQFSAHSSTVEAWLRHGEPSVTNVEANTETVVDGDALIGTDEWITYAANVGSNIDEIASWISHLSTSGKLPDGLTALCQVPAWSKQHLDAVTRSFDETTPVERRTECVVELRALLSAANAALCVRGGGVAPGDAVHSAEDRTTRRLGGVAAVASADARLGSTWMASDRARQVRNGTIIGHNDARVSNVNVEHLCALLPNGDAVRVVELMMLRMMEHGGERAGGANGQVPVPPPLPGAAGAIDQTIVQRGAISATDLAAGREALRAGRAKVAEDKPPTHVDNSATSLGLLMASSMADKKRRAVLAERAAQLRGSSASDNGGWSSNGHGVVQRVAGAIDRVPIVAADLVRSAADVAVTTTSSVVKDVAEGTENAARLVEENLKALADVLQHRHRAIHGHDDDDGDDDDDDDDEVEPEVSAEQRVQDIADRVAAAGDVSAVKEEVPPPPPPPPVAIDDDDDSDDDDEDDVEQQQESKANEPIVPEENVLEQIEVEKVQEIAVRDVRRFAVWACAAIVDAEKNGFVGSISTMPLHPERVTKQLVEETFAWLRLSCSATATSTFFVERRMLALRDILARVGLWDAAQARADEEALEAPLDQAMLESDAALDAQVPPTFSTMVERFASATSGKYCVLLDLWSVAASPPVRALDTALAIDGWPGSSTRFYGDRAVLAYLAETCAIVAAARRNEDAWQSAAGVLERKRELGNYLRRRSDTAHMTDEERRAHADQWIEDNKAKSITTMRLLQRSRASSAYTQSYSEDQRGYEEWVRLRDALRHEMDDDTAHAHTHGTIEMWRLIYNETLDSIHLDTLCSYLMRQLNYRPPVKRRNRRVASAYGGARATARVAGDHAVNVSGVAEHEMAAVDAIGTLDHVNASNDDDNDNNNNNGDNSSDSDHSDNDQPQDNAGSTIIEESAGAAPVSAEEPHIHSDRSLTQTSWSAAVDPRCFLKHRQVIASLTGVHHVFEQRTLKEMPQEYHTLYKVYDAMWRDYNGADRLSTAVFTRQFIAHVPYLLNKGDVYKFYALPDYMLRTMFREMHDITTPVAASIYFYGCFAVNRERLDYNAMGTEFSIAEAMHYVDSPDGQGMYEVPVDDRIWPGLRMTVVHRPPVATMRGIVSGDDEASHLAFRDAMRQCEILNRAV